MNINRLIGNFYNQELIFKEIRRDKFIIKIKRLVSKLISDDNYDDYFCLINNLLIDDPFRYKNLKMLMREDKINLLMIIYYIQDLHQVREEYSVLIKKPEDKSVDFNLVMMEVELDNFVNHILNSNEEDISFDQFGWLKRYSEINEFLLNKDCLYMYKAHLKLKRFQDLMTARNEFFLFKKAFLKKSFSNIFLYFILKSIYTIKSKFYKKEKLDQFIMDIVEKT